MLYDPKWDQETTADPFTLDSLIAWLEQQPAAKTYNWACGDGRCLIGQYLTATGLTYSNRLYGKMLNKTARLAIAAYQPWTMGAALKRARAFRAPYKPVSAGTNAN